MRVTLLALLLGCGAARPADAIEPTVASDPAEVVPSELASIADQLGRGEHAAGAVALEDLIARSPSPELLALAYYWQARALYHLGYTQSAFASLDMLSQMEERQMSPGAQGWMLRPIFE